MESTHETAPAAFVPGVKLGYVSLLLESENAVQAVALREGQSFVIGRTDPADVVIDDRSLSRVHARLSLSAGRLTVEDLGSKNGCFLNGKRIAVGAMGEGDVAQLAKLAVRMCLPAGSSAPARVVCRAQDLVRPAEVLAFGALAACDGARPAAFLGGSSCGDTGLGSEPVLLSPSMHRLYDLVGRAARPTLPVLVRGETGTGKELVARALHARSPRSSAPFKALNCAAIPEGLLESVLFGHERGAFSGAVRQNAGLFEQARGGTVFLDEIGELSPSAQAALLRVLELRQLVRVGGDCEIEVDVRVVAATHRDLEAMVAQGSFRQDLLYRLDALTLWVPPLRERKEEILPLARYFLARARLQWSVAVDAFSQVACDTLYEYAWPGNVRQLRNVIERAAVVCRGELIEREDLPPQLCATSPGPLAASSGSSGPGEGLVNLNERLRNFELGLIREALVQTQGNRARAAHLLGLPRRTLASKIQGLGLAGQAKALPR